MERATTRSSSHSLDTSAFGSTPSTAKVASPHAPGPARGERMRTPGTVDSASLARAARATLWPSIASMPVSRARRMASTNPARSAVLAVVRPNLAMVDGFGWKSPSVS